MTPKWKRAGPNGELEIKFPTGRRFKIEKQLDHNERHHGEWKTMEWINRQWEYDQTYSPKGYAKQKVMELGQWKNGKKVADYSHTFQYESVDWVCGKCNCEPCTCGLNEEVAAVNTSSIPNPAQTAMGPSRLPINILRRNIGKPINLTDRRRRKDKQPVLLKKFRKYIDG